MPTELPFILDAGLFESIKRYPGKTKSTPRRVKCCEVEYFTEDGGISFLNGKAYPVKKGNLLFAKPGDVRYSKLHVSCLYLHLHLGDESHKKLFDRLTGVYEARNRDETEAAMRRIIGYHQSVSELGRDLSGSATLLFLQEVSEQNREESDLCERTKQYVVNHYRERVSAADMARYSHVSVSYLHRRFADSCGYGPMAYLAEYRITKAKELLLHTAFSPGEVAEKCGFHSQSYFSYCFKQATGRSPSQYRKEEAHFG